MHVLFYSACSPGEYYSGRRCLKCSKDTYSQVGNLARCLKCPNFYSTQDRGSTSIHDCKCE